MGPLERRFGSQTARRNAYSTVTELPTGTVTFLFTDIEGSTGLLQELGESYADVLAKHRRLLRKAFEHHGGVEVDTQGDAFFVAFARASDALAAAQRAQRALGDGPVRVRIGIHTGEPLVTHEGYVGLDVHRAARIAGAAHGGQVLLSQTTRDLLDIDIPVRDLGEHRLKDLSEPQRLYQLGDDDFPSLRTLTQTNLPVQPTALVGRERELGELVSLVGREEARLVTLLGPGGAGKTRLALQLAAELADQFPGGVFFVALAPISDPALIVSTIAEALGLKETEAERLEETLVRHLSGNKLLLVLDNFERLLEGTPAVANLLGSAPRLKVLVTSRAPLRVSGEREYPVPPLSPQDAVALFVHRAQQVKVEFRVTGESAATVAEISARLDGLPLAIELAAARVKLLPPQALLARLEQRLPLLTGGPRDAPARQQTLRATIDWSYGLMGEADQALFCRLGIFAGGCSVEAAEKICSATLDGLASLVDQNLLRNVEGGGGEPRVSMLQTIREYAVERLESSGEAEAMRRRHGEYYCALAEMSEPEILHADQALWLQRLQDELDNFRAALGWSLERGEIELALRLIGALRRAWVARGYLSEARRWLEAALAQSDGISQPVRAKALYGLGRIALVQGAYQEAVPRLEESQALFREVGDAEGIVYALADLGWIAADQGDAERASRLVEESLSVARESGDKTTTAAAVQSLARIALAQDDYARAQELFEESLALRRSLGDKRNAANSLGYLGLVALLRGDYEEATSALEESLALGRELDNRLIGSAALANLALAALFQEELERAKDLALESLELSRKLGDTRTIIECLHVLAGVAGVEDESARAATLTGAADALHEAINAPPSPADRIVSDRFLGSIRAQLSNPELKEGWSRGKAMSIEEALEYALQADGA
jgi:predicted ATPase/class 3 adenylate cyclase